MNDKYFLVIFKDAQTTQPIEVREFETACALAEYAESDLQNNPNRGYRCFKGEEFWLYGPIIPHDPNEWRN